MTGKSENLSNHTCFRAFIPIPILSFRFITPMEMEKMLHLNGFVVERREGMVYDPFNCSWSLDKADLDVNYICTSRRMEEAE